MRYDDKHKVKRLGVLGHLMNLRHGSTASKKKQERTTCNIQTFMGYLNRQEDVYFSKFSFYLCSVWFFYCNTGFLFLADIELTSVCHTFNIPEFLCKGTLQRQVDNKPYYFQGKHSTLKT